MHATRGMNVSIDSNYSGFEAFAYVRYLCYAKPNLRDISLVPSGGSGSERGQVITCNK